jgi:hypothetical protein
MPEIYVERGKTYYFRVQEYRISMFLGPSFNAQII